MPLEETFQIIQDYHQLEFSYLLKEITREKGMNVPKLFKRLQDRGYILSIESLYRYFNPSCKSNRFPPKDFVEAFSEVLHLTQEQSQLLYLFWSHYKSLKRCNYGH